MTNNVAPKKRSRGKLILLEPPAPTAHPPTTERNKPFALLIGCGQFGQGLEPLPGALRDVMALYLQLSNGTSGYQSEDVKVLLDPTLSTLEATLQDVAQKLQDPGYGTLLLYVSTHGGYDQGGYHLCLSDTSVDERGGAQRAWSFAALREWLSPQQHLSQIVLLDTCRAIETRDGHQPSSYHQAPKREDLHLDGESWAIVTSSSYGELSWLERTSSQDASQGPHSLFARALLDELKTPRPGEETIEVATLHKHLQARLREQLQELHPGVTQTSCFLANFRQHPVIARRQPATPATAPPPTLTTPSHQPESPSSSRRPVWWAVMAAVLLCAMAGGVWWFTSHDMGAFARVQDTPTRSAPEHQARRTPASPPQRKDPSHTADATANTTKVTPQPLRRRSVHHRALPRKPGATRRRKRKRLARRRSLRKRRRRPAHRRHTNAAHELKDAVRRVLGRSMHFCHFHWGKALSINDRCFPLEKLPLLARYASPHAYIKSFIMVRSQAQDKDLRYLRGFTHATGVSLSNTRLTGAGLRYLRKWKKLRSLTLSNTPFQPQNARHLRHFRALQQLTLRNTYADDATLRYVGQLTQLRRLALGNTRIKGRGFLYLKPLQRLERLRICNRSPSQLRNGRSAIYGQRTELPDDILGQLPGLRSLRYFELCNTSTSIKGLRKLTSRIASFPRLRSIKLNRTRVTYEEARQLREELRASGIRIYLYAR